jgi:branched-chain amino acid transport system ATP-binding protein
LSLLALDEATIKFGGLTAVNCVTFSIKPGELFGLIGPNGAGKTTCFNLITGVYRPTSGCIKFNDREIQGSPPNLIASLGIARTFQNIRLFKSLSVLENVVVGGYLRHQSSFWSAVNFFPSAIRDTDRLRSEAMDLLRVLNLAHVAEARSADLSYGMQRRLEIARAMATQPKLLLLDEPAAGMNPQEKEELNGMVQRIRDEFGLTVLLIEHDMRFVMSLCERIVVLDAGKEIAQGPPAEIRSNPKVIAAYLGEAV